MFGASRGSSFKEFNGFNTGDVQPNVAMLREFGLPVPDQMLMEQY